MTTQQTTSNTLSSIAAFPRNTSQITQANMVTSPIRPPEVIHRLTFSSENIKRLTADDFDLGSKELIALKYDDCILVLFHVENTESYQLANIWAIVAQQVAGPVFAAINMLSERKVADAFTRLKSDGSHPLHWAALRQYPFIVVYRKRWPVAIYNGPRAVQALIDYSLTLACEAGYYEIIQVGGSMQGEARLEMGPYDVYTNIPGQPPKVRQESLQYNSEEPIRGFNPNIPLVITGSRESQSATRQIQSEEAQQQQGLGEGTITSLTEQQETGPTRETITGEPNISEPSQIPPSPVPQPTGFQPESGTTSIAVPANIGTQT